ncbi:hypothetical protein RZS28_08625 [Methylocapsa polymorpha]|uniref:Uncharacterized protein n=1 Tax=Methylocapsa polymorpha TaxID=3080828 RepID=A0ABZ0HVI3_9HYPH|nr:hypothetical protein RZS28_08625 [Methylocapsa sp. RX1]
MAERGLGRALRLQIGNITGRLSVDLCGKAPLGIRARAPSLGAPAAKFRPPQKSSSAANEAGDNDRNFMRWLLAF